MTPNIMSMVLMAVCGLCSAGVTYAEQLAARSSGIRKLIEERKTFPFLVFLPQNLSEELLYLIEKVEAAIDEVISKCRVDRTRVYVVGFSRGASILG
ncbi:hypothetical protein G6L96_026710 (plasmid) [Agrobacterium tumefaciens]|nr:hypothetical protein [Agrobacterium tumefaciens]WCK74434.1 hypothetical protein G6L96_026710 [Agrobacterium tumefaciens]